jgi:KGK domain
MSENFSPINENTEAGAVVIAFPANLFKVEQFYKIVESYFKNYIGNLRQATKTPSDIPEGAEEWLNSGVACEIMSPSEKGWQKGKLRIKISLEFCPDEITPENEPKNSNHLTEESLLDDIRKSI